MTRPEVASEAIDAVGMIAFLWAFAFVIVGWRPRR